MSDEPPKRYEDVDRIKDADGVVAVITRHRGNLKLGCAFFREFDRDGDGAVERTAFLNEKNFDAVIRLIPIVRKRMAELRDDAHAAEAPSARARR
jgi:hypothetical protein